MSETMEELDLIEDYARKVGLMSEDLATTRGHLVYYIHQARYSGATYAEIAQAAGISRQRVQQLCSEQR